MGEIMQYLYIYSFCLKKTLYPILPEHIASMIEKKPTVLSLYNYAQDDIPQAKKLAFYILI